MCDNRGIGVKHVPLLLTCELFIFSIYSRSYTRHNTLEAKNSDTFRYGVGEGGGGGAAVRGSTNRRLNLVKCGKQPFAVSLVTPFGSLSRWVPL